MADPHDVIHQIEYRWQHEKDLSPFATTMSQSMTAGWDDLIRAWVRHPHATGLSESVCYQVWDRDAALAWRYRDPRAAEQPDGTRGRPHVSRVLVGQASVLTPEVAIALCLTGLPPSARPRQVSAPDELPTISPDELTTAVNKEAAELDYAAAQQAGLPELVAAALSDRHRPLAVYLPEDLVVGRVSESPQGRLLWGLYRIMWVVPGVGRRGWSFSTFELPLGAQDAITLPDIVFRKAIRDSAPPGIVRDEVKAWPLDPHALADLRPQDVGRARWLVEAYAVNGVDGAESLVADYDARDDRTVLLRTLQEPHQDVRDNVDSGSSAFVASGSPQPFAPTPPPQRADALPEPAPTGPALAQPAPPEPGGQESTTPGADAPPSPPTYTHPLPPDGAQVRHAPQSEQREQWVGKHRYSNLAYNRGKQPAPPLSLPDPHPRPATDDIPLGQDQASQGGYWQRSRIDYMLKRMREAPDPSALHEILRFILASRADLARNDRYEARVERQEARRIMSHEDWYDSVAQSSGYKLEAHELAGIFQLIVIPDLGKAEDVIERIGGWAVGADPQMICGLLIAAHDAAHKERTKLIVRRSKKDPVEQVRQIMLPRLASRWTREKGIAQWWDFDQLP
jgi:hypothetical protein